MKTKICFFIVLFFVYGIFLHSQISNGIPPVSIGEDSIFNHFQNQLKIYPQEKIYLHLDRDYFVPGERIWFKAYLANAQTHQPSSLGRYVYVELINSSNELIDRVMLRPEENMHHGHIFLSTVLPEDYYTIRAYSSYIDIQEEDYFFKKHIYIGKIIEQNATTSILVNNNNNDFDVSFFPEGGNLLEGELCKVAFKALNSEGNSTNIYGDIIDEEGNSLLSIETIHDGMGVFGFIPEKEKKYAAVCYDKKGGKKNFPLPSSLSEAYSLSVVHNKNDRLMVKRLKSAEIKNVPPMYILLHCRGELLYFNHWDERNEFMTFRKEVFPSGVIQILLFDEQMNPLSERLVFHQNNDQAQSVFSTDKEFYDKRDKVTINLTVTDKDGLPASAHLSISITDEKDYANDHSVSILSTLLLTSELKGYIKNPAYYLNNHSENIKQLTDCLMLTHGWRRYNIPEVVKGNIEYPQKKIESSLAISGKTTTLLTGLPAKNSAISLTSMSTGETFLTTATENGRFLFEGLEYPDSTTFFLQSENAKGRSSINLRIDEKIFPPLKTLPISKSRSAVVFGKMNSEISEEEQGAFIKKASERYKYDDEMRIVYLQNIEVVARKLDKDPKPYSAFSKLADISIGLTAIEKKNPVTLLDMFNSIPGVTPRVGEEPNDIILIFNATGPAAIYINDVYMSPDMGSPFSTLNVHDIERIDVFRPGAGSGIYGLLGSNGVVSITTKRGVSLTESSKEVFHQKVLIPLGYQKPVAFYSPRYDTQEQRFDIKPDLRTTIFWKPDIVTGSDGKASFDFYTSDFSTTYSVVIEGLTNDGEIIRNVQQIVVK